MARLVQSQLMSAMTAFFRKDLALAQKVIGKDDQVDNLLALIEEKCFERIAVAPAGSPRARRLRGVFRVALNLEKLGDYAVNVAEQAVHLSRLPARPVPFDLAGPARVALGALDEVITAFRSASAGKAKNACQCETELDRQYRVALAETFRRLRQPDQDPAFLITNLFVAKFLERIGDSILNIGETTLFILTGERLKLHQYLHLEQLVGSMAPTSGEAATVDVRQIWGGISGARVGRVEMDAGPRLIWKEGDRGKIEAEIRQMEEWNRLVPGLVPAVEGRRVEAGGPRVVRGAASSTARCCGTSTSPALEAQSTRHVAAAAHGARGVADHHGQGAARGSTTSSRSAIGCPISTRCTRAWPACEAGTPACSGSTIARSTSCSGGRRRAGAGAGGPPVSVRLHGDLNTNNVVLDPGDGARALHRRAPERAGRLRGRTSASCCMSNLRHPIQGRAGIRAELARLNRLIEGFASRVSPGW